MINISDILPKVKLYIFISIISLIVNLGVICYGMIINNNTDISLIAFSGLSLITAFIPFVSILPISALGLPIEIFALITIFTSILSIVQALIIAFMILQTVKNILWQPDV